ncbi:MAG: GNAT family N-acetyltransferase [Acidimicrobiales bacterium]
MGHRTSDGATSLVGSQASALRPGRDLRLHRRQPGAVQLDLVPVRYNEELLRPLSDLPPLPNVDGIRIVPWPADRDEEIRHAKNNAFRDHWGSTPSSEANWQQQVHGFGGRPDWSFIALNANGDVVAHCLNSRYEADDELLGRRDGWINNLGTLAAYRGRGIASALIAHSLRAFAKAGMTHASIGVDSANPTGAAELYRSLGFVRCSDRSRTSSRCSRFTHTDNATLDERINFGPCEAGLGENLDRVRANGWG